MSLYDLLRKHNVECEQCGYDIAPHHRRVVHGTHVFCGNECREEYIEDHPIIVPSELPLEYDQQQLELPI